MHFPEAYEQSENLVVASVCWLTATALFHCIILSYITTAEKIITEKGFRSTLKSIYAELNEHRASSLTPTTVFNCM